jgi:RNA polymerase sigma-70 factor (sigma-E family)
MKGRDEAFRAFYEAQFPPLRRLAYRLVGNATEADDLAQDTMVRVYLAWSRIRSEDPGRYARTVMVNRQRSLLRRAQVEARHLLHHRPAAPVRVDERLIWDELLALPARQRAAIALHFYEGLPEVEVAEILGCPPGTVNSLVHRGLAKLREAVSQDDRSEVR